MLQNILSLVTAHNYLALFVIVALYLRKLSTSDSRFPITIPVNYRASVTALFGLAWTALTQVQAGASWPTALLAAFGVAATTGFFDGLLNAIFAHDSAPSWAKALVFIFDEAGGGTPGDTVKAPSTDTTPAPPPDVPPAA